MPGATAQTGALCWAPDSANAYIAGRVVAVNGAKATILNVESGQPDDTQECSVDALLPRSEEEPVVTEMDDLQELHVASVLHNVKQLYTEPASTHPCEFAKTSIYSCVGPVLIAMNPFRALPIYGESWMAAYRWAGDAKLRRLPPHCYRTAEECYQGLQRVPHQAVVICGESGAGKTVTNRKMIEYLCKANATGSSPPSAVSSKKTVRAMVRSSRVLPPINVRTDSKETPTGSSRPPPTASFQRQASIIPTADTIADTIVGANDFLESFGNAKTTRNPNSSRFGKFTRFLFDGEQKIVGFDVDHYLLERSRINGAPDGERNYHIFYELLRSPDAAKYGLTGGPENYNFTRQGADLKDFEDAENYARMRTSMSKAGAFSETYCDEMLGCIAALLILGNVEFKGNKDESSIKPESVEGLKQACGLLGINADAVGKALTTKTIKVKGSNPVVCGVGLDEACAQRDGIAKAVYSSIFDDLVGGIALSSGTPSNVNEDDVRQVGLLDIFGFEDMAVNGFEQMFINLANERIQHLFNSIMFERELVIYKEEGVTPPFLDGPDNIGCVKLFSSLKPAGIVKRLTDQCVAGNNGMDGERFVSMLNSTIQSPYFEVCSFQTLRQVQEAKGIPKPKRSEVDYRECFSVVHYAGKVVYTVRDFVPKSRDALLPHLNDVMTGSSTQMVSRMFDKEDLGPSTVGEKFVSQLDALARTLEKGETVFVRCIKANPGMRPGIVNRKLVLEQLVNGGVVSALQIRQMGLPDRLEYKAFCREYGFLEHGKIKESNDPKMVCAAILRDFTGDAMQGSEYAFGHTKVFMHSRVTGILRNVIAIRTRWYAKQIQNAWRIKRRRALITRLERCHHDLEDAVGDADEDGVDELPAIKAAISKARTLMAPAWDALQAALAKGGSDESVQEAVEPFSANVDGMRTAVHELQTLVQRAAKRMAEYELLASRALTALMEQAESLRGRVEATEEECSCYLEMLDAKEQSDYAASVTSARAALRGFEAEEQKARAARASWKEDPPADVDWTGTDPIKVDDFVPAARKQLEEARAKVEQVEHLAYAVLRVRREFAQAVAELDDSYNAAAGELASLNAITAELIAGGLNVDGMDDACRKQQTAIELKAASRDCDAFRRAVGDFIAAVAEAKRGVEAGRELLERRRREAQRRQELHDGLDELQERLSSVLKSAGQCSQRGLTAEGAGQELRQAIAEAEMIEGEVQQVHLKANLPLDEWQDAFNKIEARVTEFMGKLADSAARVMDARKTVFNKRRALFGENVRHRSHTEIPMNASSSGLGGVVNAARTANMSPEEYIKSRGSLVAQNSEILLRINGDIGLLKQAGVPRSAVTEATNQFVTQHYGALNKDFKQIMQEKKQRGLSEFAPDVRK
eukprot:TRINITY_DN23736_c0_g1_i2.p1 TRINITY_DN23736_c0_g1~~TRINITY_DN23736_c0_g1_i2.p1  ORF type:complete len:1379 (-),score=373.45 TRINITY_DN23736_c0_g1_i2:62-4198(-)